MPAAPHKLHFAVLAVDTVAFRLNNKMLEVLLVPAAVDVYKGRRVLPGGLIHPKENAETAAARHLHDKGGLSDVYIEQLYTFSGVKRDPRGRVVSVAYLALTIKDGEGEAAAARWHPVNDVPKLGYDHDEILSVALERLRTRVGYTTIIRHLLPSTFTLTDLQQAYEIVLEEELDKRNFRKKILALDVLTATGKKRTQGASRPAALYRFSLNKVQQIGML